MPSRLLTAGGRARCVNTEPGLTPRWKYPMPEAASTDTRSLSGVVAAFWLFPPRVEGGDVLAVSIRPCPDERELVLACQSATSRREAMDLLTASVAELHPSDPRHEASYAVAGELRPGWVAQLERVSALPALGVRGMAAKAALIVGLAERDEAGHVVGTPVLRVAASLADDLLRLDAG